MYNRRMSSAVSPHFAQVVVLVGAPHLAQPFTYGIPDDVQLTIGDCVLVPFPGAARYYRQYI